jgi:hypothetical protein
MRVLRGIFALVGTLAALLAGATVVIATLFYTPGVSQRALWGSLLYLGIALGCFYAFFRMKPARSRAADDFGRSS